MVLILLIDLAQKYYRYLLIKKKDMHFDSISFFWGGWIVGFANLYQCLYELKPILFSVRNRLYYLENSAQHILL